MFLMCTFRVSSCSAHLSWDRGIKKGEGVRQVQQYMQSDGSVAGSVLINSKGSFICIIPQTG